MTFTFASVLKHEVKNCYVNNFHHLSGGKVSHFHNLSGGKENLFHTVNCTFVVMAVIVLSLPPERCERTFTTKITAHNNECAIQYEK